MLGEPCLPSWSHALYCTVRCLSRLCVAGEALRLAPPFAVRVWCEDAERPNPSESLSLCLPSMAVSISLCLWKDLQAYLMVLAGGWWGVRLGREFFSLATWHVGPW